MKSILMCALMFSSQFAVAGINCGDLDKGYYLEFPHYEKTIKHGLYEVEIFKDGQRKKHVQGWIEGIGSSIEFSEGNEASSSSTKKLSTEIDGYALSIEEKGNRKVAVLNGESGDEVRLACDSFSDPKNQSSDSNGASGKSGRQ